MKVLAREFSLIFLTRHCPDWVWCRGFYS